MEGKPELVWNYADECGMGVDVWTDQLSWQRGDGKDWFKRQIPCDPFECVWIRVKVDRRLKLRNTWQGCDYP